MLISYPIWLTLRGDAGDASASCCENRHRHPSALSSDSLVVGRVNGVYSSGNFSKFQISLCIFHRNCHCLSPNRSSISSFASQHPDHGRPHRNSRQGTRLPTSTTIHHRFPPRPAHPSSQRARLPQHRRLTHHDRTRPLRRPRARQVRACLPAAPGHRRALCHRGGHLVRHQHHLASACRGAERHHAAEGRPRRQGHCDRKRADESGEGAPALEGRGEGGCREVD